MWVDNRGSNFTSQQICENLSRATGSAWTVEQLEVAYKVGYIYRNGNVWFQRLS